VSAASAETLPWWKAAADHRRLVQRRSSCGATGEEVSGRGTVVDPHEVEIGIEVEVVSDDVGPALALPRVGRAGATS
jgi:hypothetical protein